MPRGTSDRDPLDDALRPPVDETEEERSVRLQTEEQAKRVSDAIDETIRQERQAAKKKDVVHVLLLGQSESGKSTTLKQFQRLYTPTAFREERHLWRSVIQLNIVRSIRIIIDTISDVQHNAVLSEEESDGEEFPLSGQLIAIGERLKPLRHIESILVAKLVPPNEAEATHLGNRPDFISSSQNRKGQEIFVRPGIGWHGTLLRGTRSSRPSTAGSTGLETPDDTQCVLDSCRADMIALWQNSTVRAILQRRKVRLEELPGFYLNDLERMTSLKYVPTDDDVLKARLKTVGVCEYKFHLEASAGSESGTEWRIIDVGGSRSQVWSTWAQFFDTVNAILFLAPISGFDQALAEDRSVNRLEDSVLLWKSVCTNKLLAGVELVLFLNKCDLLDAKLKSGIRLAKYVRSFGDRPNDLDTVTKYFRGKFSAILREHSPNPRKFYGFCTSVTDTSTTAGILAIVRDVVIREHLKQTRLL